MKRLIILALCIAATASAHATTCGSFTIPGSCYYLSTASNSPAGNDSNNGTSAATPWLTPYHAVNCGDMLLAASGAYDPANFYYSWHSVTCAGNNNVAWVACATAFACTMSVPTSHGVAFSASYWGMEGFAITGNSSGGPCIQDYDSTNHHHLAVVNNVLIGCGQGGVAFANDGATSVDYLFIVGNITYGTSGGSGACTSGLSVYQPVASDTAPGTHIYFAGNYAFLAVDGNPCAGGAPTDGNGIIFDTFDGSQSGGAVPHYTQQAVAENNLLLSNGARGFNVYANNAGSAPWAKIYVDHNTMWGNNTDSNTSTDANLCAPITINTANNVEAYANIVMANASTGCHGGGYTIYGMAIENGSASDLMYGTVVYAASGTATHSASSGSFAFGPNNVTANPSFASAAIPGSPSCGAYATTAACMASVIANFQPSSTYAAYGIQPVSSTSVYNPLFPNWACANIVNEIPAGLITPGCTAASTLSTMK